MARLIAIAIVASSVVANAAEPPYFHLRLDKVQALGRLVRRQVVLVEVARRSRNWPYHMLRHTGAGVHVGGGKILTCAFFLTKGNRITVRLPDGRRVPATLARKSLPLGLAAVEVPEAASLPATSVSRERTLTRGATVYLLQNPATGQARPLIGTVVDAGKRAFYGRATFAARNGHPVFDEWGRLAAVSALPAKELGLTMLIPPWAIQKFLERPTP